MALWKVSRPLGTFGTSRQAGTDHAAYGRSLSWLRSLVQCLELHGIPRQHHSFSPKLLIPLRPLAPLQIIANMLESPALGNPVPYVAFDLTPARVQAAQEAGFNVLYGDAAKKKVRACQARVAASWVAG